MNVPWYLFTDAFRNKYSNNRQVNNIAEEAKCLKIFVKLI